MSQSIRPWIKERILELLDSNLSKNNKKHSNRLVHVLNIIFYFEGCES